MTTQTQRTTLPSPTSRLATVQASMVMACCGLVLWGAVAAQAGGDGNVIPLNGTPLHGVPLTGLAPNGTPLYGMPRTGLAPNAAPLTGLAPNGAPLYGLAAPGVTSSGAAIRGLSMPPPSRVLTVTVPARNARAILWALVRSLVHKLASRP